MSTAARGHRFACLTAGATVGLIVAGGLVTSTGAGLAVPDWPTTFGQNMFLAPWSQMVGGVLVEHTHRLVGAAIGLLTVGLALTLALVEPRRWVRALGGAAVALVSIQGVIGGLRVVLRQDALALLHGCVAPVFFGLLVALAVVTGRGWAAPAASPGAAALAPLGALAVAVVYGQVVLGALTTHAGWLWWHVAGAGVTTAVLVGLALAVRRRAGGDPVLRGWARGLKTLLGLQLALGLGAYLVRFTDLGVPGGQLAAIALPVVHRAVGSLVLGAAVALALHLGRRRGAARRAAGDPRPGVLASGGLPA